MMTRQDFNLIQKVFSSRVTKNKRRELFSCQPAIEHELRGLAKELADELDHTYSNFNKAKFLKGCGL